MKLTLNDVLDRDAFQSVRARFEQQVIDDKRLRRIAIGPNMTLLFENRLACWWQVQEMLRVEGITDPKAIQHELDTYNALLPGPRELSATLLVEYDEPVERDRMVRALRGLQDHVSLVFAGDVVAKATFDAEQFGDERISSVQFLRIPLGKDARGALWDLSREAKIVLDHPAYSHVTALMPTTRAALVEDLTSAD